MNDYETTRLTAEELARIDFAVEMAEKAGTGITLPADQARKLLDTVAYWVQRCGEAESLSHRQYARKYTSATEYCIEQHWIAYSEQWSDELGSLPIDALGGRVIVVRDREHRWRGWSQLSKEEAFKDAYRRAFAQDTVD